jgi:hypothetical protein
VFLELLTFETCSITPALSPTRNADSENFYRPAFLLYMGLITPEGLLSGNANQLIGAMSGVFQVCHPNLLQRNLKADAVYLRLELSLAS